MRIQRQDIESRAQDAVLQVSWIGASEQGKLSRRLVHDGEHHDYQFKLPQALWSGTIRSMRIDPVDQTGIAVDIDRILLHR